jgi:hypothetical protein
VGVRARLALARCAKRHSAGTLDSRVGAHGSECRNHAKAAAAATTGKTTVRQRLTFLEVPHCNGISIPPLEVEIDPMVGRFQRTMVVEPLDLAPLSSAARRLQEAWAEIEGAARPRLRMPTN